ncbi:NAD(P)H-dependent oxidoreductase [Pseudomonas sp. MAFF212428]|uniref:NAD(P)H-dependent oxidoreductase n=1 Tax=Pseudomonas brassicae TaxID=2708063 RepID=A0A6B3NR27_9PSED|nr:NAD(P)H-dependent oxidoreductase [Pseudomonas brassicae]NER61895.1 NAD(P)H-dependent oxidoreductase [Pseudomonas brassicae]NER65822.1 NAD(P)H-dependent oxidoreductase [Pseudomonas brassicae]
MHALIVVAHHDPQSLTHSVATQVARGVAHSACGHSVELADLYAEGFNPVFGPADHAVHRREAPAPADVLAEQARLDRADALVLVYPVYWWSMPGLLKGWIDRVFANGWAFDFQADATLVKKLGHLNVHLIGIGGADAGTYQRHGYAAAMKTQIEHGIFDYCAAPVVSSTLMLDAETQPAATHLQAARVLGGALFASAEHAPRPQQASCQP